MKNLILFLLIAVMLSTACKKQLDSPDPGPQLDNQSFTQVEDNNDIKEENDQTNDEVNNVVEYTSLKSGRMAATNINPFCGCSVDSSQIANKIITLVFDNITPCGSPSRYRSGSIRIQLQGNRWRTQAGSILKVSYNNFKVRRGLKSWTFNGDKYLTNLRAVNWGMFLAGSDSVLQKERSNNMQITFTGGLTASYSIARKATIKTINKGGVNHLELSVNGDTLKDGKQNTDTWGTNRFGKAFSTYYTRPFRSNSYCWFSRPVNGELVHKVDNNNITVTLGVNEQGNPDARDCAFGWKIRWMLGSGSSGEKVYSY